MFGYLTRRGLQSIVVLLGLSLVCFLLIHSVPGDPARLFLGPRATNEQVQSLRHQLGLDRPLWDQYLHYDANVVRGRLGTSISTTTTVNSLVLPRVSVSLLLILYSLLIAVMLAVPLAVVAALRKNGLADHAIRVVSAVTFTMPTFWLGLILTLVFAIRLGVLPVSGYGSTFLEHIEHLTLPAIAVGLAVFPILLRVLRASLVATLDSDYIEAARSRGLSATRITLKHAFKNSILAPLTVLAILVGALLSGTVVAENVFALPGLGTLFVTAVQERDYPTVQALVLIFGAAVIIANLLADLAYPFIDRRVQQF
jgi:peptide/nickel transport system permease protein